VLGYQRAFWLDSATFLFSAGAIALIRFRPQPKPAGVSEPETKLTTEVLDGMRFIAANPTLRGLLAVWATAALGFGAALTISYLLALERYDAGAQGLAILDIGITVGLLIGSLTVALPRRINDGWKIVSAMVVFGIVLSGLALADQIAYAVPLLVVTGIANMWFLVPSITIVQLDEGAGAGREGDADRGALGRGHAPRRSDDRADRHRAVDLRRGNAGAPRGAGRCVESSSSGSVGRWSGIPYVGARSHQTTPGGSHDRQHRKHARGGYEHRGRS
jgi:hypothetical protein